MARKRKKATRRRRSGRRMGAIGKAGIQNAIGIIAGAIIARKVIQMVPIQQDALKGAVVAGIGVAFPTILKSELGKALGNGMIAVGGQYLVASLVPGLGAMDDTMTFPMTVGEIPDNLSVIAGDDTVMAGDDLSVLAGMEEDEMY